MAIIVMVIAVTATLLFFKFRAEPTKDTKLVFTTSPRTVNVSINGTDYGSVEAGTELVVATASTADIEVTKEGFEAYANIAEVTPGATNQIHVALIPETDEAWALIDEEEDLEQEQEVTESYLDTAEEAYKKYPILEELPHEANLFSAYQGIPKNVGYDFGLHLHLYKGQEAKGREAFNAWMGTLNYDPKEYDVVETIRDEVPPVAFPEPPSMKQLQELTPENITIPANLETKGLDADEVAQLFAVSTTTWDTAKDTHHSAALIRAAKLMTKDQAGLTQTPEKPTTTPSWRAAAEAHASSKSWIKKYESQRQSNGTTTATVTVCWAWITEDNDPKIEGPRTYELTITKDSPAISKYNYKDPDPFVDNSQTPCLPADA